MSVIDYSAVPESVWVELCRKAISCIMEDMKTPEGRAVIEKGRQKNALQSENVKKEEKI